MNKELAKSIGSAARRARTDLKLTQEDAAERINMSVEFYARIERGNSMPSVQNLRRIAEALGVSADVMLGRVKYDAASAMVWRPAAPVTDTPEVRRIARMLRRAKPGTLRLVTMLLKELQRTGEDSARAAKLEALAAVEAANSTSGSNTATAPRAGARAHGTDAGISPNDDDDDDDSASASASDGDASDNDDG
ncbi:MAG: hypothetical protein Tsb0020_24190 [Haliangiales bacterium]